MDVLFPPLIYIDGRVYRRNPMRNNASNMLSVDLLEDETLNHLNESRINSTDNEEKFEKHLMPSLSILRCKTQTPNGFTCKIYVPELFIKFIIGPQKSVQQKIERDFKCKLNVPSRSLDSMVFVLNISENNINGVIHRINWLIQNARQKVSPTHFIALPILDKCLQSEFLKFKNNVLAKAKMCKDDSYKGIENQLFTSKSKLHITICSLVLADRREIGIATKIFSEFSYSHKDLILNKPLNLSIRGFEIMNDDPTDVRVLYAKLVEDSGFERLQSISNALAGCFAKQELQSGDFRAGDRIKLHLTVLNSRLRMERLQGRSVGKMCEPSRSEPFSAVGILRDFSEECFISEGQFGEIQLLQLRPDEDERTSFYPCIAKLILSSVE